MQALFRTRTGDPLLTMEVSERNRRTRPASAGTLFLQIKPLSRGSGARACPRVLNLMYPSRTRELLSVLKTHDGDRRCD